MNKVMESLNQDHTNISTILQQQRQFFATGTTLSVEFRLEQLKKLKSVIQIHEADIAAALKKDLNKAFSESLVNEIFLVIKEINFVIKNLKKWSKPKKLSTPLLLFPGHSELIYEPFGSVLLIGPWNYPFLLMMSPLIGALSAGNCVVVKPSEIAVHSQNIIAELLNDHFSREYIAVVKGGHEEVKRLLAEKFDYIFFTGGTQIGRIIMEGAAKHLTPVTLELGGKSPCIVDQTADLDYAARRIAWGKTTNAGQTCISPDYLYVHESCKTQLIEKLKEVFIQFYGADAEQSDSYSRIINKRHFDRLVKLMQKEKILFGGKINEKSLYISPTLMDNVSWQDPIMQEEIFGPILPILSFKNYEEVISAIHSHPKPLALYLFSKNKDVIKNILAQVSFGGGCINDCLVHIANVNLPFGGIGESGIGNYHGKYSFETFSHKKSIYKKSISFDFKLEYPPYSVKKIWWIRQLFKI